MSRVALLVLAHDRPHIAAALAQHATAADFDLYMHVDAKTSAARYREAMGESASLVRWIDDAHRHRVAWGGYSMIEATSSMIRAAMAEAEYDVLALVSDDTSFLVSPQRARERLLENPNRIDMFPTPPGSERALRYRKLFILDTPYGSARRLDVVERAVEPDDFERVQEDIATLTREGKSPLALHNGSQWWALNGQLAAGCLDRLDADKRMQLSFRYAAIPDESCLQTLVAESGALSSDVMLRTRSPMLSDFTRDPKPYSFASADDLLATVRLQDHEQLFVRKVRSALLAHLPEVWESVESLVGHPSGVA